MERSRSQHFAVLIRDAGRAYVDAQTTPARSAAFDQLRCAVEFAKAETSLPAPGWPQMSSEIRSPIERDLHSAIVEATGEVADIYDRCVGRFRFELAKQTQVSAGGASHVNQVLVFSDSISTPPLDRVADWHLYRQAGILGYKLDFLLVGKSTAFAVECDGFDFHEKTPQQATYDKTRDRELAIIGMPTLRFTGSEIHRDAERCAAHVHAFARYLDGVDERHEVHTIRWLMMGHRGADFRIVANNDQWTGDWGDRNWTAGMLAGAL